MTESECSLLSPEYCIIEEGAGLDGRVGASVGLTGRVGGFRGLGIFLHGDLAVYLRPVAWLFRSKLLAATGRLREQRVVRRTRRVILQHIEK